jgi:aminopeptidase
MKDELLRKYAELAVKTGVNIQKDQLLVISSPIECAPFTRLAAEIAYEVGAKDVIIQWNDEISNKIRYLKAPEETFDTIPQWLADARICPAREGAAFLSISASDPELLKDVDPKRIGRNQKASQIALKEFSERLMSNRNSWSIVSIPTVGWATKVFPNNTAEEAVELLWEQIFKVVRVDNEDPVAAWDKHKATLKEKMTFLNSKNFKTLQYTNAKGTDLTIELPEGHIWAGGADYTNDGVEFIANMPTEEVFTLPKKTGVNGIVYSSKPLNYGGNLIDDFSITFENGRIVSFTAAKGYDVLKSIVETDEGSHYLGEVALVPYDSPISNSGVIFFNTLYDENASCHLAIGASYSINMKDGENLGEEELEKRGANQSLTHIDFMVGTEDLNIIGTTNEGEVIQIFKSGNWAF